MIEIQVSVLLRIPTPADVPESALMRSGLKMLASQLQGATGPKGGTTLIEALAEAFARPLGEHEIVSFSIIPRVAPSVGFLGHPLGPAGA